MKTIKIESKDINVALNLSALNNATSKKISQSLPIKSKAMKWGDEIYFDTNIAAPAEGGTLDVDVGDVAYWPEGKCLCIFFGKTPASSSDKPRPASKVVIVAKADVNADLLRKVKPGSKITVE